MTTWPSALILSLTNTWRTPQCYSFIELGNIPSSNGEYCISKKEYNSVSYHLQNITFGLRNCVCRFEINIEMYTTKKQICNFIYITNAGLLCYLIHMYMYLPVIRNIVNALNKKLWRLAKGIETSNLRRNKNTWQSFREGVWYYVSVHFPLTTVLLCKLVGTYVIFLFVHFEW